MLSANDPRLSAVTDEVTQELLAECLNQQLARLRRGKERAAAKLDDLPSASPTSQTDGLLRVELDRSDDGDCRGEMIADRHVTRDDSE